MKGLSLLTEGSEIVYADPLKLDMWGTGTVQGVEIKGLAEPMVKILFNNSISANICSQFLSLSNFGEKIKQKEIEDANRHQWMLWERDLVKKPIWQAVTELQTLSRQELSTLLELLKRRVKDELRLWREEAVLLIGELSDLIADEEERELFKFLLEQTEANSKKRGASPQSSYSLSAARRFQREQYRVVAKSLQVAAEIAQKKGNEEMASAVKKAAERLQAHSSQILKRTAKTVLASLGR